MRFRAPSVAASLFFAAVLVGMIPQPAWGNEALGGLLSQLVRAHYAALHDCYRPLLARHRSRGGTVFMELEMGRGGRVVAAKSVRDELQHGGLAGCLASVVRRWSIPALEVGAKAVIPLTFRADPGQFLVRVADLRRYGGFKYQVALLTAHSVGIRQARMNQILIRKSGAVAEQPGAFWFVLEGRGRLVSKAGQTVPLRRGEVVAPGVGRLRVEAAKALRILIISPTGQGPPSVRKPRRVGRWRGVRGFRHAAPDKSLFVGVMGLRAGQQLLQRVHMAEDALFYVLQGKGEVVVDGRKATMGPGIAVGIEARRRYGLRAISPLRLLVAYAPSGPQRQLRREGLLPR